MRFETYVKMSILLSKDRTVTLDQMRNIQSFLTKNMSREDRMMKT
jgi:hypothetical protein